MTRVPETDRMLEPARSLGMVLGEVAAMDRKKEIWTALMAAPAKVLETRWQ